MQALKNEQIPSYSLEDEQRSGGLFTMNRLGGAAGYGRNMLVPHRKDYYLLVFVRQGQSRHWVDMKPYVLKNNAFYFTVPHQVHVKEEPKPLWGTSIAFTKEFLALQDNALLSGLPLIRNPHNGHELLLNDADVAFVEDILGKLYIEYSDSRAWRQRMLAAYLTALLTYLSRLYTEQFNDNGTSSDKMLLEAYQGRIEECFRALHEVSAYASLLHISAGHLSEVVKAQSGKPAIKHIHERLVLEARRLYREMCSGQPHHAR